MRCSAAKIIKNVNSKQRPCPDCINGTNKENKDKACETCDGYGSLDLIAATNIDIDALWKTVSHKSGKVDDVDKLALADALHEAGDLDTASILDWCVKKKRWPKLKKRWYTDTKLLWSWAPASVTLDPKSQGNGLPRPIHEFVEHMHDTIKEAIESLTAGFVALRESGPKWRT